MPTDNPKVSGYVPQNVYDRLIQFKDEQGVSISQAVTIVIAEYFGIETQIDVSASVGGVTLARLEALENQVSQLLSYWESTQGSGSSPDSSSLQKTRAELAKHFGVTASTISSTKSERTQEGFLQWTRWKDPDGVGWIFLKDEGIYQQESELPGRPESGQKDLSLFGVLRDLQKD